MAALLAMKARAVALAIGTIAAAASLALPGAAVAQQKGAAAAGKGEQFFPVLVYRTGAYGPNGTPWANGYGRLPQADQRTGRHQRRQDHLRGVRDGV